MLHLSVELVQEIVAYLDISDQKHLRSVSRYLAHTTDAIFFKTLPLKTISLTPEHHQTLVQSGWPRTATNLVIDGIAASTENPGREQFSRVLKSLQKVRTVRWDIGSSDQPWILQEISRFLSANSLLNDLWLGISNQCSDSVLRHALQELDGICNLGKLEIYCPYITTELISNTLVQLVSQNRRLETLKDNTSLPCAVWRALCDIPPPVHLKSLSTRLVTEELLEYLGTYSGLESITLSRFDARDDVLEQSLTDRLADNFFSTVVPKHAASLVELSLSPSYEGRWCLGTGSGFIFAALRSLPQIRRLSLCINSDDLPNYEGDLTLEGSVNVVKVLIDLVSDHPCAPLKYLGINVANHDGNRHADRGNSSNHFETYGQRIVDLVEHYEIRDVLTVPKVVYAAIGECVLAEKPVHKGEFKYKVTKFWWE